MSEPDTPTCPHCGRELEDEELLDGVCSSDDCPRHDNSCQICGADGGTSCGAVNCVY